jgi:hypothetical protein
MKIASTDYNKMKKAITDKLDATPKQDLDTYLTTLKEDSRVKDINVRFRWDILHASRFNICSLYHYMNDTHIDTALKAIMKELGY